jgi:hypothetical protein
MNSSKKDYIRLYQLQDNNQIDVEERLFTFPVEWLENVNWLSTSIDIEFFKRTLRQITDDFLLGKPNSLGKNQPSIEMVKPFNI